MKKVKNRERIFFLLYFIGSAIFAFLIPLQLDDWAWGGQIGIDRLSNWFDNYSGRYFGNLIVLALTRSIIARCLTMSVCFTGIIYLVYKITGSQKSGYVISAILGLFMPLAVFNQTVAWISGFSNYVTSIFLILIYIYATDKMYLEDVPKNSFLKAIPFAVLGFASALIVEHVTMYSVVLGIYTVVYVLVKHKKILVQNVLYMLGTIVGTVLMFSNSCYSSIASGEDDYRKVETGIKALIHSMIDNFEMITKYGVLKNTFLNFCILIFAIALFRKCENMYKSKFAKTCSKVSIGFIAVNFAFTFMNCIGQNTTTREVKWLSFVIIVLYAFFLTVFFLSLPVEKTNKIRLIFMLFSIAVLFAPLLVVNPVSERCFYPTYIMFVLLTLEMYRNTTDSFKEAIDKCYNIGVTTVISAGLYLIIIFSIILSANEKRLAKVREQVAAHEEKIVIEKLPYGNYMHYSSPSNKLWIDRYKIYYGIPEETEVVFKDFKYK